MNRILYFQLCLFHQRTRFGLKKDLNIIVVDGEFGFGNNFVLPAGPLRENINSGIKKSQILILLNDDKNNIEQKVKKKLL